MDSRNVAEFKAGARNYHNKCMRDEEIGHNGPHWQYCNAPTCTAAFFQLVNEHIYGNRELKIRARAMTRLKNKLKQQYDT